MDLAIGDHDVDAIAKVTKHKLKFPQRLTLRGVIRIVVPIADEPAIR